MSLSSLFWRLLPSLIFPRKQKSFGDVSRYRDGVNRAFSELHLYLAGIHSIKLRPQLHRALVLVEFLLEPGPGELRRKRFFADEEGAVKRRPWRAYFEGDAEGLVGRLE